MKCPKCNGKWVPAEEYGIGGMRCMICGKIQLGEVCKVVMPDIPPVTREVTGKSTEEKRAYWRMHARKKLEKRRLAAC